MTLAKSGFWTVVFSVLILGNVSQIASAQEIDLEKQLNEAALKATKDSQVVKKYELQYRLTEGELIRSRVVHLVSMDTKIDGEFENLKSRSVSTRVFQVEEVDQEGNITLIHRVEDAELWQKVTGQAEVRYNSRTDEIVPENYERIAASIGKPLAVITVSPSGAIVSRKDEVTQFNPGIGVLMPRLPDYPIAIGQKWYTPEEVRIRTKDGRVKSIKLRKLYTLSKVSNELATITVRTQVITPVHDAKVKSQLMQRMQHGEFQFDLAKGRIYSTRMELDERVVGFNGAASMIHYLSRMTEQLLKSVPSTKDVSVR